MNSPLSITDALGRDYMNLSDCRFDDRTFFWSFVLLGYLFLSAGICYEIVLFLLWAYDVSQCHAGLDRNCQLLSVFVFLFVVGFFFWYKFDKINLL